MAHICNKLEKLVPPPFITLNVDVSKSRTICTAWSYLGTNSNYSMQAEMLEVELDCLRGYIERKGTQLRLEKALLLTAQVLKLCQRWKLNDFLNQFKSFKSSFVDEKLGSTKVRYPTSQWGSWILYLTLRESALLAKIKLECEHTTKYWLGLIAASHHFGDSLVITGILARVWHLASKMVEEFVSLSYPKLRSISLLLQQSDSVKWPESDWEPPENLGSWIRHTLNLSFRPDKLSLFTGYTPHNNANSKTGITPNDIFFIDTTGNFETKPESQNASLICYQHPVEDDDDNGVIVKAPPRPTKKKKAKRKNNTENAVVSNTSSPSSISEEPDWRVFKKHWTKFFTNTEKAKLKFPKGRKKLLTRLKKYKQGENVSKRIRLGLTTLMKSIRGPVHEEKLDDVSAAFVKFERRVKVESKRIKNSRSSTVD